VYVCVCACACACCCQSSASNTKKSKTSSRWNRNLRSPPSAAHRLSDDSNIPSDDRQQCISRRHRPYFSDLSVVVAEEDEDTVSGSGLENPAYNNNNGHPPRGTLNGVTALPSPESRQLAQQSELERDNSTFGDTASRDRWRPRRSAPERPVLFRFVSDMSDVSNSTASTSVPLTPSQRSDIELNQRL